MDPNELVERIRSGDAPQAIAAFLAANPSISMETLAGGAVQWGLDDVSEPILRALLEEQPEHEAAHDHLADLYFRQKRYAECIPHYRFLCARFPDRPPAYGRLCWACFYTQDIDGLRTTLDAAQKNIADGHHLSWQAGASLAMHLSGEAAEAYRARHRATCEDMARRRLVQAAPPPQARPDQAPQPALSATTLGASEIGTSGAVLSAAVGATGNAAEYRFEYGPSPGNLSGHTPWRSVPGRLNAEFYASPHWTPAVYSLYAARLSWDSEAGAFAMDWPFGKDPNHISGIGFIDLLAGLWPNSCQIDGKQEIDAHETGDLRDGTLTFRLKVEDMEQKDFLFCLGVGNVGTYWMLAAEPVDLSGAQANGDVDISVRLTSDPTSWTFFGNNPHEQTNADRYHYGTLHDALSHHLGNVVLTCVFGDWRDTPTGRVAVKEAVLTYRDRSVLHPDTGTRLIEGPASTTCDPGNLTNGRRGAPDAGWYHIGSVDTPIPFRWQFAKPANVSTLVLHQDPVWPTRKCRIGVTTQAGQSHNWDVELPSELDTLAGIRQLIIRLPDMGPCQAFSLELLEGADEEGLGLEAVELFAPDHVPPPSPSPVSVCEDAVGLEPGSQLFYRVVCRSGETILAGETRETGIPANSAPRLHDVVLHSTNSDKTVIRVRANAMGHETTIRWRLDRGAWRETALGWEQTATHRYLQIHRPSAGPHLVEVVLNSAVGESRSETVRFETVI